MSATKFLAGFIVGGALGAVAGILLAPKSGKETRELLVNSAKDAAQRADETVKEIQSKADSVVEEMQKKGWIDGLHFIRAWGGNLVNVTGLSQVQITGDGIQYLCDNSTMRKTLEWLRDHAPALPGMVTTIIGILS